MKGSVRQHGKGWQIRYWYTDATGRRRQRGETAATKAEAERLLRRRLDEVDQGNVVSRSRGTLVSYLDYWLTNYAQPTLRPTTVEEYKGHIRRSIVPHLGQMELQRITPIRVQQLYALLLKEGRSSTTVRQIHAILRKAFGMAVEWQIVSYNPVERVRPPPVAHYEPTMWTPDELRCFCRGIADHAFRAIFLSAICTGLRRSELLGLKVASLDLSEGALRVTSSIHRIAGSGMVHTDPKTRRSRRLVLLGLETVKLLREELGQRVLRGVQSDYVFCDSKGGAIDPGRVSKVFRKACIEVGVRPIRFQDLRHLHASLMLGSGEHLKAVSERMGHSSISTTFDTYAHLMPNAGRESAEVVEREVFGT